MNQLTPISQVPIPDAFFNRIYSNIECIDDFFGGGILPGAALTLHAAPGTGKSTFLMQLGEKYTNLGIRVGFCSGEQSAPQLAFMSARLNVSNLPVTCETNVDKLCEMMKDLDILIVDSFQKLQNVYGLTGRRHEKYCTDALMTAAQLHNCTVIVIMHHTKAGQMKGSTYVAHMFDGCLSIEIDEESKIRRFYWDGKNRFGDANKELYFEMGEAGYTFENIAAPDDFKGADTDKEVTSKNDDYHNQILKMVEPPGITVSRVMEELGLSLHKSQYLLKELTTLGKLIKFGRGTDAIFKFPIDDKLDIEADEKVLK